MTASGAVTVLAVDNHGPDAVTVTYKARNGALARATLVGEQLARLSAADGAPRWTFTADGADFRLVAEALRIRMAGLFDATP